MRSEVNLKSAAQHRFPTRRGSPMAPSAFTTALSTLRPPSKSVYIGFGKNPNPIRLCGYICDFGNVISQVRQKIWSRMPMRFRFLRRRMATLNVTHLRMRRSRAGWTHCSRLLRDAPEVHVCQSLASVHYPTPHLLLPMYLNSLLGVAMAIP